MNTERFIRLAITWFFLAFITAVFLGCSEQFLITKQEEQSSVTDLTYDQFTLRRKGQYFEAVLKDSSRVAMQLQTARYDSILYTDIESGITQTIPTQQVVSMTYRQNDNGLYSVVGGFIGFFIVRSLLNPMINFNDDGSVIAGFVGLIGGTTAGAVIGYQYNSVKVYQFRQSKQSTP